jgi:hypothetical protein
MRNKPTMLPFMLQRLRRLTPIVSTAVFAACMGLAPGARADVIYNYVFSPGAGYAGNGDSASLSGTFSWDATTGSVVASDIGLSGTDATGTTPGSLVAAIVRPGSMILQAAIISPSTSDPRRSTPSTRTPCPSAMTTPSP